MKGASEFLNHTKIKNTLYSYLLHTRDFLLQGEKCA